jgi:hypothetical protein
MSIFKIKNVVYEELLCSQDSSIGIATRLPRNQGSIPGGGKKYFSFPYVQTVFGVHPVSYPMPT